jgi:cob(I)alamin adenosyltransferase
LVKLNRIYTRTGDDGSTGLVDGSRISKADALITAIGDVDEANSAIGVVVTWFRETPLPLPAALARVQNDLFDLGADLATPAAIDNALRITADQVARLEAEIDAMNADLAPLTSFIHPGGSPEAAAAHLARAIVRRAERSAVAAAADHALNPQALKYLNRLSDWLFVSARWMNISAGGDVQWVPGASR